MTVHAPLGLTETAGEVLAAAYFFNYVEAHFKVILSRKVFTSPR